MAGRLNDPQKLKNLKEQSYFVKNKTFHLYNCIVLPML